MNRLKNLIRLLAILALLLSASPALVNAYQFTPTPNRLPEDFRNFQNFGSLGYQPDSQEVLAASNTTSLEMIGHLGGYALAVALDGSYAYLATDGELAVVDVSDPANPLRIGYAVYPSRISGIYKLVVSNERAYIFFGTGLTVIDISDPFKPIYLGVLAPGNPITNNIYGAIHGSFAYLTMGSTLVIYDLSQPGLPQQVGSSSNSRGYQYEKITISSHFAYVLSFNLDTGKEDLEILDLTTPTAPQLVGKLENLINGSLAVQGNYVYIPGPNWVAGNTILQIVDVSNSVHPLLAGSIEVSTSYVRNLVIQNQSLYMTTSADSPSGGLLVYSLQDPAQPVLVASVATKDVAYDVALTPDMKYAFVADYGRGLRAIDVNDPAYPIEVGAYDPPSSVPSMEIAGGYAFTSSDQKGIRSIDLSDPRDPKTVGFIPAWSNAYDLHVDGNYAYTAELYDGGIRVYDIADPAHMKEIASVGGNFTRLVINEGYLYAWAAYVGPVSVIDIHDPYQPVLVGSYNIDNLSDIAFNGSTAYIATIYKGCQIVDFSDPASPMDEGKCLDDNTWAWAVEISSHYAFLNVRDTDGNYFLQVLDISIPSVPVKLAKYAIQDNTQYSLSVAGDIALLYDKLSQNLIVVDVADPHFLHRVGSLDNGYFYAAVIEGNNLYLGNQSGLYLMKLVPTLSGHVTDASLYPIPGVLFEASSGITTTTDTDGFYAFKDLVPGTYTITPTLSGYTFAPPSLSVRMPIGDASQDFTLLPEPVSVMAAPGITATLDYTGYQGDITHIEISSGAFNQPVQVIVTPTLGMGLPVLAFPGHAFDLSAEDSQGSVLDFGAPVTATIAYTDFDIRFVTDESQLNLFRWNGSDWEDATTTCSPTSAYSRDLPANQISLPICQAGKYALYGPTHAILYPAILMNFH